MADETTSRKKKNTGERVIEALLLYPSPRLAAHKVPGLSEATIYRYRAKPEIKAEYDRRRRQKIEGALAMQELFIEEAVTMLYRCMTSPGFTPVQLKAAQAILANVGKGLETSELLTRLEAIEDELKKKNREG